MARKGNQYTSVPQEQRFWNKVVKEGPKDCWLWIGTITANGYGQVKHNGRDIGAHRAAYQILVGPIPDGLTIDHLCRNRRCVNPTHLEPVTTKENLRRGLSPTAINARKTHCIHGHEFTKDNTYHRKGIGRRCRTCARALNRVRNDENRASIKTAGPR